MMLNGLYIVQGKLIKLVKSNFFITIFQIVLVISAELTGVGRKMEKAVLLCLTTTDLTAFSCCLICSKAWLPWGPVAKSLDDSGGSGSLSTSILEAKLTLLPKQFLLIR